MIDGSRYPRTMVRLLVSSLNMLLSPSWIKVIAGFDRCFDSLSCELHKQRIGVVKHCVHVIDEGHEIIYWEKHLLGYSTPKIFQRTVFCFMLGSIMLLEVCVQEHHDVVPAQFCCVPVDGTMTSCLLCACRWQCLQCICLL